MSADRGGEDDAEIIIPNTPHECAKMICARGRGRRRNDFHTVEREHFHKMLLSAHSDHGGNDLGVINCNQFKNTIFPQVPQDPLLYCKEDVPYLSEEEKNGAREALENQKKLENEYLGRKQKAKEAKAKAKAKTDKSINRKDLNKGNAEKAAKRAAATFTQSIKRRNQERNFAEKEAERQANANPDPEKCFNALCEKTATKATEKEQLTESDFRKNRKIKVNHVPVCEPFTSLASLGNFAEMKCPSGDEVNEFFNLLLINVKR